MIMLLIKEIKKTIKFYLSNIIKLRRDFLEKIFILKFNANKLIIILNLLFIFYKYFKM